ncbi:MAG: hypothetical protein JST75_12005 [Bacteroidetes bacterium]|nr:hypothetical protein [Bacteroidota bacterium]
MKKSILFLAGYFIFSSSHAQKCMEINITALMGKLEPPGQSASSFSKCNLTKNDEKQTVIVNYGTDLVELDTFIARTAQDFNMASLGGINAQMPSQQDIASGKDLAEKLKNMTPEQQKQWAMQMVQEKQRGGSAATIQDNADVTKLVFQTQDAGVNQLRRVNEEFAAKLRDLNSAMSAEKAKIKPGDKSGCPQDKTGLPSCACANEIDGKYWEQIVKITDSYNSQRTALLQAYIPKIKALVATVDDNVVKLKHGDAVNSKDLKRTLFSAQASAFSNAFDITKSCIDLERKDGSNAYVNKFNCDNKVYNLSCFH